MRMHWKLIAALLCTYGALKEFKPIEPYLYRYHNTIMNISEEDLNSKVYPIWTYSYLFFLFPVLLLTDLLLYKPILLIESCSYIAVWLLLIHGRSVFGQQIGQLFYGCATATEIAYFAYIYVKVDRSKFARVTVWTRTALQVGKCLAYFGSQIIMLFKWGDLLLLNYISLGSVSLTFLFALSLPFVHWRTVLAMDSDMEALKGASSTNRRTIFETFEQSHEDGTETGCFTSNAQQQSGVNVVPPIAPLPVIIETDVAKVEEKKFAAPQTYGQFLVYRIQRFKFVIINDLLQQPTVMKWSIWWALSTCGDLQVSNYIQTLWGETQKDLHNAKIYNGFVEGTIPLLASLALLKLQRMHVDWAQWGESCLTVAAAVQAIALLAMATTSSMYVMYGGYTVFRILYQCMITVTQFNIICQIGVNTCGFIFGVNMFIALLFQAMLTMLFVDQHGPFLMSIRPQFYVYAGYHGAISLLFLVVILVDWKISSAKAVKSQRRLIKY